MISVNRFTQSAQEAAQRAAAIMQHYGHHQIDAEHMLLALLEQPQGVVSQILEFLDVDANVLLEGLDQNLRTVPAGESVDVGPGQVSITPHVVRMIDLAVEETHPLKDDLVSDEHLLLAHLSEPNPSSARLLQEAGLTRDRVYDAIQKMRQ